MKAKIFPLEKVNLEASTLPSSFCLHIEIICASLAYGTSTIKGIILNEEIKTTIEWCKNIGASIKQIGNKLIIKGVDNDIKYKQSLFVSNSTSTTAKLMIPLLSRCKQPFGIKANKQIINELVEVKKIYEMCEIGCFVENDLIRFEKTLESKEQEFESDLDFYVAVGLLLAYPLVEGHSIMKLRAPVRNERNYAILCKILRHFSIEVKHPATMRYEIYGKQSFKSCKISTDMDYFYLCHMALMSQKLQSEDEKIRLTSKYGSSTKEDFKFYTFIRDIVTTFEKHISYNAFAKKEISFHQIDYRVENSLPYLIVVGLLNNQDSIIGTIPFNKKRIKHQFTIMSKVLNKLNIQYEIVDDSLILHPCRTIKKVQLDCENDPYVAMAIAFYALLVNEPLVIKNAQCIFNLYDNFYEILKGYNVRIEIIHD